MVVILTDKLGELLPDVAGKAVRYDKRIIVGRYCIDQSHFSPDAQAKAVAQIILILVMLIVRQSDCCTAHVHHHAIVTLTLRIGHRPAVFIAVLMVVDAVKVVAASVQIEAAVIID